MLDASDRLAILDLISSYSYGYDTQDWELFASNLREHGFEEGVSTRLLAYTGELIINGIAPRRAADIAIVNAVSDDGHVQQAIADIVDALLP